MSVSLTKSIGQIVLDGEDVIIWHTEGGGEYWLENYVLCLGMVLEPGRGWCHIEAGNIASVDTQKQIVTLKDGRKLPGNNRSEGTFESIKLRPMNERQRAIVASKVMHSRQQEQTLNPVKHDSGYDPSLIDAVIIAKIRKDIEDQLDGNIKSPPSHSDFFACYCRDRLTITQMSRKHKWPARTLKFRKHKLLDFLKINYRQTLDSFLNVEDAIFREAQELMADGRARRVNRRKLAGEAEED